MKYYQITFSVPDDFDPDQLELSANDKYKMELVSEGFVKIPSNELSLVEEYSGQLAYVDDSQPDQQGSDE